MAVVGVDDTDSREAGMCTTYVAARVAGAVRAAGGRVTRSLLVRLNPAVEHKTRGNAALAVHVDLPVDDAFDLAAERVEALAAAGDPGTNPGVVVAPDDLGPDPAWPPALARRALHEVLDHESVADRLAGSYRHRGWGNGRGLVGATAAVGAWRAFDDWTHERLSYRHPDRWGTPREVDADSAFAAVEPEAPPAVWDTVDRGTGELVCVPRTPCPVLHGVRGDDPTAVERVSARIESEPVDRAATFLTNQGTDAHLRPVGFDEARGADATGVRVDGVVADAPGTRRGGHVFLGLVSVGAWDARDGRPGGAGERVTPPADAPRLDCVAFEPTKRFRDRVRALRVGDRVTVCGEADDATVKLEKFALRDPVRTERVTPTCPDCGRTMESAGRDQGYRCRDCGTSAPGKVERPLDRDLAVGWHEVPPRARRHVAKPLVRGGFDAPTHPER
jgi:tRNA(Ile2)-agmatinylcytidine synthase